MFERFHACNRRFILIAGILFAATLSACAPAIVSTTSTHPWANALRALDPADAPTPAYDLTAVYLRQQSDMLQIRIDLLDFQNPKELSLDIKIDSDSIPEPAPLEIHIPSDAGSTRVSSDPALATVIVEIPISEIPSAPRVDVSTPEDKLSGLTLDGPVPTGTAPLLLTFYDTFAGRFPAEALRSWDGAHTGPRGERHGLKYLLDAAEEHQTPIVLLDLKTPANLSALDAIGVLPRVKSLAEDDLLILPENLLWAASSPPELATQFLKFGLPSSPFSYQSTSTDFQFVLFEDAAHLYHLILGKTTYLPIATETDVNQPTPNGPSLDVRRALLESALNADEKDLFVLGGSFRNTTWGSPDMVGVTLAYFASRPYIHMLTEDDLLGFPTKTGQPDIQPYPIDEDFEKLEAFYQALTQPVLEFADNWNGSPLSNCETDIDYDNQPECILANEAYLAVLDPQGARLTYLFTREENGIHQLIGPSWQVAVGLSASSTWDLSASEAADPGAYPGAFADEDDPFKIYEPTVHGESLVFKSLDGTRAKTFKLAESGIEVEYQTQEPIRTQIPLLVDPDSRFTPGWAENYVQQNTPGGIAWGLRNGPMVRIQVEGVALSASKGLVLMRAFNESLSLLDTPEDPDFDYPPGHYIPFPMAVAEVEMGDGYFLRLERLP